MLMLAGGSSASAEFCLLACDPAAGLDVTVNGERVHGVQTKAVAAGDRIGTRDRACLLRFSPATRGMLGPHADCELMGPDEMKVTVGQVYVEGPATVFTPMCRVHVGPGAVAVRVNLAGEVTVGAISGAATVSVGAREVSVPENEAVTVMADKSVFGPGNADPLQVVYSLPLNSSSGPAHGDAGSRAPSSGGVPPAVEPQPEQQAPVATTSGEHWDVHTPALVRQAVLCRGVDHNNHPVGIASDFPSSVRRICLYLRLDFGSTPHQVRIRWSRGSRQLTGRIVRASGHREMLNSLSAREGRAFSPGDYQVTVSIDDQPAATLDFTVREGD